jgi:hypothetical protein
MHQEVWGYKIEEKLHLGVLEQERLNTTEVSCTTAGTPRYNLYADDCLYEF